MAATVGKLIVTLTARTGKFQKGLRKAGSMVGKFASGLAGITKKVLKFGAIMATAAVAGIAFFTKKAFESIDATAKLARQIGISIDGLRGLNRAAIITGASQEDVAKAVGVFSKTLGEAAVKGIGLGKDALDALGLSAKDLIDLPVDESVAIIADEMNKMGTQAEKAFVASKLFGRGGLALVNTLALGSKGLAEMAAGAQILQGSLSAFDAAKVEEANDAIADMRTTWTALFERVAVFTGPIVKRVADFFTKLFIWIRTRAGETIPKIIDWFKRMATVASTVFKAIFSISKTVFANLKWSALAIFKVWSVVFTKMKIAWLKIKNTVKFVALDIAEKVVSAFSAIRTQFTTLKAILSRGWGGIGVLIADMWDNVKIAFLNAISWIGNKLSGFAKWLVDKLPGENAWAQNLIKGYDQGLGAVDRQAADIADKSRERWGKFWDQNKAGREGLTSDLDKLARSLSISKQQFGKRKGGVFAGMDDEVSALNTNLDVLIKSLTGRQADILAGRDSGAGWAVAIKNVIGDIQGIKLPAVTEAFAEGGAKAGSSLAKAVKTITTPAAIEKGTVAAFSTTVRSTYKQLADTGKQTVSALKEGNKLQREANKLLAGEGIETVGIA